jgi:hypothetical protein
MHILIELCSSATIDLIRAQACDVKLVLMKCHRIYFHSFVVIERKTSGGNVAPLCGVGIKCPIPCTWRTVLSQRTRVRETQPMLLFLARLKP